MASERKTIKVTPGSELAILLDEVSKGPVLLDKDGTLYRVSKAEAADIWVGYDPALVLDALTEVAGSWADVDTDTLVTHIYAAREEGSRPPTRP